MTRTSLLIAGLSVFALPALAGPSGGPYSIPWSTIDGGGILNSSGGTYTLSGTIGQPDASGVMTGGTYSLTGGFWAGIDSSAPCAPDLNGDGNLDFFDVSFFLSNSVDYNGDTNFDFFDVSSFLQDFGIGCP